MAIETVERFDMGRVFQRAFAVLGANALNFIVLALLLSTLPTALMEIAQAMVAKPEDAGNPLALYTGSHLIVFVVSLFVAIGFSYVLQGAVIRGAVVTLNGGKASLAECLSTGLGVLLPAFAISILVGLGVWLGLILLVVPGIIVALAWCVALPVRVMESRGIVAAISRSADLTRNHRWALLGLFVVMGIGVWVVSMVVALPLTLLTGLLSGGLPLGTLVATPITNAIGGLVGAVFVASVYYELRFIKEGVGAGALAAIFD